MLVSPPVDPPTNPVPTPSTLPFPLDETTYNNNLQRKKCPLVIGSNTLTIVGQVIYIFTCEIYSFFNRNYFYFRIQR